ncbi:hypothetical protein NP493_74g01015 [Ridgeia piscesae]|uniref:G-protein coupled receptors family 1 profile domain-containing protein n=1 Tax=Ridgeia piscesae TaxID=27915 RepID=A0AAD9P9B9_RIDPI|nr:hypothetical protein NP493_74g01015 [Ridgeia piscesae]
MAAGVYATDMFALPNVTASSVSDVDATTVAPLSEDVRLTVLIVRHILIPVIAVLGVLGNIFNIVVLTRKWMRSSTNYYLTALAIYDIVYLVFAFLLTVVITGHPPEIMIVIIDIASNTGVWLTLTFTVERYICVCHPMRGRVMCTPKRAKYVIASVCIAGALITFPAYFRPSIGECPSFKLGYLNVIQALFTYIPMTLLLIFNTLLVRNVMRASRERAALMAISTTSSRRARRAAEQSRVTTMLIVVVVVFFVCQLPQAVMNTTKTLTEISDSEMILHRIGNLLVVINCAVNFVLYSSVSSKFRRTFAHVYRRFASRIRIISAANAPIGPPCTPMHSPTPSPAPSRRGSAVSQIGQEAVVNSVVKSNFLQVNAAWGR